MADDSQDTAEGSSSAEKTPKPRNRRTPRGPRASAPSAPASRSRAKRTPAADTAELPFAGAPEPVFTPTRREEPAAPPERAPEPPASIAQPRHEPERERRDPPASPVERDEAPAGTPERPAPTAPQDRPADRDERDERSERNDRGERGDGDDRPVRDEPVDRRPERGFPPAHSGGGGGQGGQPQGGPRDSWGGGQHGGGQHGGGGGGGGGDWGFRKKFKKDKFKNKFGPHGGGGGGQQGGGPHGGGGQHGGGNPGGGGGGGHVAPRPQPWKQPAPPTEQSPLGVLPPAARFANFDEITARALEIAGEGEPLLLDEVAKAPLHELIAANRARGVTVIDNPGKARLVHNLFKWAAENRRLILDRGHIDTTDEGHGFVVHLSSNFRLLPDSTYVPATLMRRFGLKRGHEVEVQVQAPNEGERCPAALVVRTIMGGAPEEAAKVVPFEELTPYYPTKRIFLEVPSTDTPTKIDASMRCVDILTPIGFGQRGLIVAPPRTGKTILLQGLANSIATNFPEVKLIILLVDERPEEVTDFRRNTRGEVISSTFDESPESHVHAAEMVSEKAKRMVERGEHVVILLDSITRLGRAYNALASNSGKIMSGGIEATALQKPKRFFGAARNIEGAGSLTIMGTALVDTNSRMDEVIFEEFKGTGNMELHLDRDLVNKRIFPAINFERSGTRKEELLYHPDELQKIYGLRRIMLGVPAYEAMEMLIQRLKKTRSNAEFLLSLAR